MFRKRGTENDRPSAPAFSALRTALLFVVSLATIAARPQQAPRFVSESSELVVLPVTVTDGHDRLVANLPRDRFIVYDNGRRQPIELFSNEDTPVTVGLIVDDSGSMAPKLGEVIAAALAFARSSNQQDEIFAIAFNDRVQDTLAGRLLTVGDIGGINSVLRSLVPQGRTALYDALVTALDRISDATRPRKVLIVISDGGDNASVATLKQVLYRARQSNVTIYTIGVFDANDTDTNPGVLKALAHATGGERFMPNSPGRLVQVCDHIAREIRSGYTIGFVPPDRDGAFHRVRVEIQPSDRHLNVRTRPGYFAAARMTSR
jgi:VWFA-related protein